LDRGYEDRLQGQISDDLWSRKSVEWERELHRARADLARCQHAAPQYAVTGLGILELVQRAHAPHVTQDPHEQARLHTTLVSNCAFDRGSVGPTYNKPFDLFAKGSESGDWLTTLDDFRNWLINAA
jgi:hypothetical protein